MRTPLLTAAAAVLLAAPLPAAAPVPAATKAGGPPLVLHTQPVGKLLDTVRAMVKVVAGPDAVKAMDGAIANKLGEKGFAGLDLTRPVAGYLNLPDKVPVTPEDWLTASGAVIVPITTEAEFKDLLARAFDDGQVQLKPVKGDDGLFAVERRDGPAPIPVHVRFVDKSAHVGINVRAENMAAAKLPKADAIVSAKDPPAMLTVKSFPDRYPEEMRKNPLKGVEAQIEQMKQQLGGNFGAMEKVLASYIGLVRGYSTYWANAEESGYRVTFDEGTAEVRLDTYAVPKKGTDMARDVAARKAATNAFGSLVTAKAVAAASFQIPTTSKEFRDLVLSGIESGEAAADENAPEAGRPVIKELLKGLGRTVKGDSLDFAVVCDGPDKDGHFTVTGAVSFADAVPLEKAIKAAVKDAPKELQDGLKLDADKVGGINIHEFTPPADGEPEGYTKVFGKRTMYVAFGPKGVYFSNGADGPAAVKRAIAAKPGPAKEFEVAVNPKRLGQLVAAANEDVGGMAKMVLGEDDKLTPAVYLSGSGEGGVLTYRMGFNLKLVAKPFAMARVGR